MLTVFQQKVLELERSKLLAIQNKLPGAIHDRDLARVVGLAQAAERIAARLVILLNNVK